MTTDYEKVVMDGANLIHDDTGIEKYDDVEGSRIIQILPDRLEAAINHCENLGWPTVACLKRGTYKWAATNPESKYVGDISIIDRLISEGKVILLSAKKEDIYWIDYALKENAWIVTHDRFNDKKGTQGERSLYPDRDWKEIDSRTLRGHEFVNNKFILPGLPKKQILEQKPDEYVTLVQFNKLVEKIIHLEAMVRKIDHSEILRETSNPTEEEKSQTRQEIMEAVMDQYLSNEKRVEIGHFHRLIASAILSLDMSNYPRKWPKGWTKTLEDQLGFEGKFYDALINNSKRKICIGPKKGKKGTSEVFYC